MSITTVIIGALGGSAATLVGGVIANKIVSIWKANEGGLEAGIEGGVKRVEKYFEDGWGIELAAPESTVAHDMIMKGVAWVDQYAGSKDFMKKVVVAIMTLNPAKFAEYMAQLKGLDLTTSIKGMVEAELLTIINQTKKEVAISVISNKAVVTNIEPIKNLDVKIDAAVAASKVSAPIVPVTSADIEKMIVDSQKRQDALLKK